jgi:TM2 domain-containing membrane protein YozV
MPAVSAPPSFVASPQQLVSVSSQKSRVAYILLGLFLGGLGIHNFYAGYTGRAVAQLLITLLTGWLIVPIFIVGLWVLIEVITVTSDARGVPFN